MLCNKHKQIALYDPSLSFEDFIRFHSTSLPDSLFPIWVMLFSGLDLLPSNFLSSLSEMID